MIYTILGKSNLKVSGICMGCCETTAALYDIRFALHFVCMIGLTPDIQRLSCLKPSGKALQKNWQAQYIIEKNLF